MTADTLHRPTGDRRATLQRCARPLAPFLCALLSLTALGTATAQDDGLPGDELAINSATAGRQVTPDVIVDDDGSALVVWQTRSLDGGVQGIAARGVNADGSLAAETLLAADGVLRRQPAIARTGDGSLLSVWIEDLGASQRVVGQRFGSDLTPIGSSFEVSGPGTGPHYAPQVTTAGANDDFIVAWESRGASTGGNQIAARRYDATGPVGEAFPITEAMASCDMNPALAGTSDGGFIVSWTTDFSGGAPNVVARRFSPDDVALEGSFQVNSYTPSAQQTPDVAVDGADNFLVVWASHGPDGSGAGVYGQRYDADGFPVADEFRINDRARSSQLDPEVEMDADGNAVVVWQNFIEGGEDLSIYARRVGAVGGAVGAEFQVNSWTTGSQTQPAVHVSPMGEAMAVWQSDGQDGDLEGVFAQRVEPFRSSPLIGPAQQITDTLGRGQSSPVVATAATGDSLVVWPHEETAATQLAVRAFDVHGVAGPELSLPPGESSRSPAAAGLSDSFVVVWSEYESTPPAQRLRASRHDRRGELLTAFDLGVGPLPHRPAIAGLPNDEFVVTWRDVQQVGAPETLVAQRYDADGFVVGARIEVADLAAEGDAFLRTQDVSAAPSGGELVVVWQAGRQLLLAQRVTSEGELVGEAFRVNDVDANVADARIGHRADGSFLVTWQEWAGAGSIAEVFVRRFSAEGQALGDSRRVAADAGRPLLAIDRHGRALISWIEHSLTADTMTLLSREVFIDGRLGTPIEVAESALTDRLASAGGTDFLIAWRDKVTDAEGDNALFLQRVRPGHRPTTSSLISLPAPQPIGTIRPGRATPIDTLDP